MLVPVLPLLQPCLVACRLPWLCIVDLQLGVDANAPMPSYSSSERSWREDARDTNMTAATGIANAAKVSAVTGL
jgi:hypothetical protein